MGMAAVPGGGFRFARGGVGTASTDEAGSIAGRLAQDHHDAGRGLHDRAGVHWAGRIAGRRHRAVLRRGFRAPDAQWRAGQLRPLCVFDDERMPYKAKVTATQSWNDIPTCKEAGVPTDYVMLRGIFMAPGVTADQTAFYVDMLKKIRETPEWKDYMEKGAFNQTFMTGADFSKWLDGAEKNHRTLMTEAGFLAK